MRTRITGADIVLPRETARVDVVIEGDKIADIDPAPQTAVDETVDAAGLHLIPGVVDDQVHFREPGLTHKEDLLRATRACARGGVTTFLEMPNTSPTTTSQAALDAKLALASQKCVVNYGFYVGATPTNVADLREARRTPGIKIFIGSSTGDLLVDDQDALERIFAETTLPITAHCEDEATIRANRERIGPTADVRDHSRIRDHRAAVVATERAFDLARRHNHRFHLLHVSTADEVPLIREQITGDQRQLFTAEACLHHLLLNVDDYDRLGTLMQVNPSIKTAADNEGLWSGLLDGTLQVVATDHAPHTLEEKQQPYPQSPSGMPGVETSLAVMLDQAHQGRCTLQQVVHWMCDAPARTWDILHKGRIEVGRDADLVLVDLEQKRTVSNEDQHSKCGWSAWAGRELTGWPVRTWVMGQVAYQDGRVSEESLGQEAQFDHALGGFWVTQD
ncbi:MAG: dihydroorotase [Planctomycetota bacterium]